MMDMMKPPPTLLDIMGVWASLTGVLGFLANGAAISLFCRSSKVQIVLTEKLHIFFNINI